MASGGTIEQGDGKDGSFWFLFRFKYPKRRTLRTTGMASTASFSQLSSGLPGLSGVFLATIFSMPQRAPEFRYSESSS
jgi:hypothetical protein